MNDTDIKEICERVAHEYGSKIKDGSAIGELWRAIYKTTAKMVADILIECNRVTEKQSRRQDD